MVMDRRTGWSKWIGATITAVLLVAGLSVGSFADLRIVTEGDDERSELLIKGDRVVSRTDAANWMMVDCKLNEVTFVADGRYWTGPIVELKKAFDDQIKELSQVAEEAPSALGFLGGLLSGSTKSESTQVRVTRLADETVAGYGATQYRVETGSDSKWTTFEIVSVSSALLQEVKSEIGDCMSVMIDFSHQMASLVPSGAAKAVYSDPSYQALFNEGYPVKSVTRLTIFGVELDFENKVVGVSRNPVSDDVFALPVNYRKVENPSSLF